MSSGEITDSIECPNKPDDKEDINVTELNNGKGKGNNINNRGTGAGGSNTNKNGVKLEDKTRGTIDRNIVTTGEYNHSKYKPGKRKWKIETINHQGEDYIRCPETAFKDFEEIIHASSDKNEPIIAKAHGAKEPDDAIINALKKTINWLECKAQNNKGSVAEKLQTSLEKIRNLERRFPGWKINYVYILDSYFREAASYEVSRLDEENIKYIFEDDKDFEKKLMNYSFM